MKKRTLWIFNHYALPPDLPGGTRHFDLACELVQMGYDVTLFASAFNHKLHEKVRLSEGQSWELEEVEGVKFVWLPAFAYQKNNWRRIVNMLDYTWRAFWAGCVLPRKETWPAPPDVVIGCSVHLFAVLAGYYLSRYHKAHFLMEVRDLWPQTFIDMGLWQEGQLRVRFFRWLEQYLYERAERIITLSPLTRQYLGNYSEGWADKTVYIPNGTRVRYFKDASASQKSQVFPLQVMFVGSMGDKNKVDLIVSAMRIIEQHEPKLLECVLVGDGPAKPKLQRMVEDWHLQNVRFVEPVPRSEVPNIISQADILILVEGKVLYGSSNKSFDYMAAAKPIVTSVFAQHNNLVEQAQCGVSATPNSPKDLAEKLLYVAKMPEEDRRAMGLRGYKYVKQHYDYSVLACRLARAIEELNDQARL